MGDGWGLDRNEEEGQMERKGRWDGLADVWTDGRRERAS